MGCYVIQVEINNNSLCNCLAYIFFFFFHLDNTCSILNPGFPHWIEVVLAENVMCKTMAATCNSIDISKSTIFFLSKVKND